MYVCLCVCVCVCVCLCARVNNTCAHRESTSQVKGAATNMVTVVATKELKAGDVLLRFKAKATQDEHLRGN